MKVVFKNFFRNEMVNLTAKSVRHFMPEAEIYVVSLFKKDVSEYYSQPPLEMEPEFQFYRQTKYHGMGSSIANAANGLFFSEGYNCIAECLRGAKLATDEKVLMLAEDHFFTTGQTIKEIKDTDFDIAYAAWDSQTHRGANGSILCVRPSKVNFPIEEKHTPIEGLLQEWIDKAEVRKHRLSTRDAIDYKGDGFYSNSAEEIRTALKGVGIV